ncbi:hypothetical protein ISG33_15940 [Glaciecola sp. MH2013]|uniref:hypothetical protein n=1 Tax=Glaciecola sp. MH2013 TaxID=2785524 RepID=UPI00189F7C4B|nr:hypothetical protein [Glaciecola sp. MH2013]MBF7074894.1 hypothetical protein [Glaciecola sp. MH2013]
MFKALSKKLTLLSLVLSANALIAITANAELILSNNGTVVTSEDTFGKNVDLNGDGIDDLNFIVINGFNQFEEQTQFAGFTSLFNAVEFDEGYTQSALRFSALDYESLSAYQVGDVIGESTFSEGGSLTEGVLYSVDEWDEFGSFGEVIPNVGDSAFLGFMLTVETTLFEEESRTTENFFGFLQVTHGSINVGTVGIQTIAGASATVQLVEASAPAAVSIILLAFASMLFRPKLGK